MVHLNKKEEMIMHYTGYGYLAYLYLNGKRRLMVFSTIDEYYEYIDSMNEGVSE